MTDPTTASTVHVTKVDSCRSACALALEVMREIKTPLETLSHLTYLAREEADDSDKVRMYMQMAEEHVTTLSRIASHTLGLAADSVPSESTDLVPLAEYALRIHQRMSDTKKIHLVKDLPAGMIASVQAPHILQAVSSLIVNAIEALPHAGTLSLRLRKRQDGVHILIVDNGHGIAAEHMDKIYEPFFSTRAGEGRGLGLSLSRKIIEDHNGRIHLRSSVRVGQSGTAFKIFLPAS